MTSSSDPNGALKQLDRHPHGHRREHGQVLIPAAFWRHLSVAPQQQATDTSASANDKATLSARESPQEAQLKHELALAYTDLGGATFALAHHGALNDPRLASRIQQISKLNAQLAALAHATEQRPHHNDVQAGRTAA